MAAVAANTRAASFICTRCRHAARRSVFGPAPIRPLSAASGALSRSSGHTAPLNLSSAYRYFHDSTPRPKKKNKDTEKGAASQRDAETPDPYDFEQLQAAVTKAHARLKDELAKLKPGGAFNVEAVENLRVRLRKESQEQFRLKDIAQCVPRGRTLMVIVAEQEYLKPVSAGISSSGLSLTPEKDQQNPLQLNIKLPPPTAETRKNTVNEAVKIGDAARQSIATARSVAHKHLQKIRKSVRDDDFYKASEKMEKLAADANTESKRIVDSAKKVLENQ